MATNTYVEIETQILTSNAASITFSSIPQTYTDLVLVINGSTNHADNGARGFIQYKDSTSLYSTTNLIGGGSSASSGRDTGETYLAYGILGNSSTNLSTAIIHIFNYANTTTFKTMVSRSGVASASTRAYVGLWRSTDAITSLTLRTDTGYRAGTTVTLYGIANSNIGAPKAFGGTITQDSAYTYHTFSASGTFTPQQSLTADILVVAGGGGGGARRGGGGGAGGLLAFTSQSLTATGYTVTVGSGGAGGSASGSFNGTAGGDSRFGDLTLVKGGGLGTGDGNSGTMTGGSGGGNTQGAAGGTATSGQGNNGGAGSGAAPHYGAGGGGGAGAAGSAGTSTRGGDGGNGTTAYEAWGLVTRTGHQVNGSIYYAGGGGGGAYEQYTTTGTAVGGFGGGGRGGLAGLNSAGLPGLPLTGGGGGGSSILSSGSAAAGAGGSGVVIIRYAN